MTAAVMGMPSHYGGHGVIGASKSPDLLDRFFSGWENAFCAPRSVEALAREVPSEKNVLDYVFDHVESYTCSGSSIEEEYPEPRGRSLELVRDNSLLEQEQTGPLRFVAPLDARNHSLLSNLGHEGDILDRCFDRVESFVCSEGGEVSQFKGKSQQPPRRNTTNQHRTSEPESSHPIPSEISTQRRRKKKKRRPKQNMYPDEEDNILLYYRPVQQAYE